MVVMVGAVVQKNRNSDSIEPAALIDSAQLAGSHARYIRVASL